MEVMVGAGELVGTFHPHPNPLPEGEGAIGSLYRHRRTFRLGERVRVRALAGWGRGRWLSPLLGERVRVRALW